MTEETVTIKKSRFDSLIRMEKLMLALEECGVDNWEGYGEAQQIAFSSDHDEEDEENEGD